MNQLEPPVFLVGALRSGTTILRLLLDQHPDIHWFGEFEYPVRWCDGAGWPDLDWYRARLELDRAFLRDRMEIDPSLGYIDLARSFLEQHRARAPGDPIFGCTVHSHMERLPEIWPGARYIHLLRDPRDVARSVVAMGWAGHPYFGVDTWLRAERRWDELRGCLSGGTWCEIRYEELVRDAEPILTGLCEFLGVPFDARMLAPDPDLAYGPPDASFADQWKRKMGERELRLVEGRAGQLLENRGYERSGLAPLRPGATGRALLHLRNRWGKARFAARRYGTGLWLQRLVANRLGPAGWRRGIHRRVNAVDTEHLR